jgi:peptide/nickel transport system substrate-binding protein
MPRSGFAAVAAIALATAIAGCGSSGGNGSGSHGSGSNAGGGSASGSAVVAVYGMPTGNSLTETAGQPDQVLASLTHEGLTRTALNGTTPEPALATSWSSNAAGTVWTFKLRKGVKWQDGKPFTADDVKYTFDTLTGGKVRSIATGYLALVKKTAVVDPDTVKVTLKAPQTGFPRSVGYNTFIVPKHLLQSQDPNKPSAYLKDPIGTGPFEFQSASAGTSVIVRRNPNR